MAGFLFDNGDLILKGWRGVAGYLGCSVSTAKRYYKKQKLPVRQYPSGRKFSLKVEIDTYFLVFQKLLDQRRKAKSN